MIPFKSFVVLIEVISGARKKATEEHLDFLEFYKDLVSIIDHDTAVEFGSLQVPTVIKGVLHENYRLELNPTDYTWWRSIIIDEKGRFKEGPQSVQLRIWDHLVSQTRMIDMTPDQRQRILNLEPSSTVLQISKDLETG